MLILLFFLGRVWSSVRVYVSVYVYELAGSRVL